MRYDTPVHTIRGFFMSNATKKVRTIMQENASVNTLTDLRRVLPDLKASEISMALCYLMKQRYLTRMEIENTASKGRKKVWRYQYHAERVPAMTAE